jgi:hypothetical protein
VLDNIKMLKSFLGFARYYRKFVRNFGIICKPLTELLKKHSLFQWTSVHQEAFAALKQALVHTPVLALPDFSKQFILEMDASDMGVGAMLMQQGHPLAFISKALGPRTRDLSTYEKEYLAILIAIDQWRSYLQVVEFVILTDQKNLIHLSDQRLHTHWQQKVFIKLIGLQYKIAYIKGSTNRVVDALSRHPAPPENLLSLSSITPSWLDHVQDSYSHDDKAKQLLAALAEDPNVVPHFTLSEGIMRYKRRIWIGDNVALQTQLLEALHCSAIGGHSGFLITYHRMKQLFAWSGMKRCQPCLF